MRRSLTFDSLENRDLKTGFTETFYQTPLDAPDEVGGNYFYISETDPSQGGYYVPPGGPMPGSDITVINNLGNWQVGGTPQIVPVDPLDPGPVNTSTWIVVGPNIVTPPYPLAVPSGDYITIYLAPPM